MGLFSEIKKLFFAQKSVAESAVNKAKERGEELMEDTAQKSKDLYDKVKEEGGEWVDSAKEKGAEWAEKAKEKGSEWAEKGEEWAENAKEKGAEWAEKASEKGEEWAEKAYEKGTELKDAAQDKVGDLMSSFDTPKEEITTAETPVVDASSTTPPQDNTLVPPTSVPRESFVERLGKKVIDTTEDLGHKAMDSLEGAADKAKELSENIGEKVMEAKDQLVEKSKDTLEYLDQKLDETVDKAKKLEEEINANDQDGDGFADTPVDLGKSELSGKDDFFEKAKSFAEGKPMDPNKVSIESTDTEKVVSSKQAYGFEDLDGDGNELIDDAIIEEE